MTEQISAGKADRADSESGYEFSLQEYAPCSSPPPFTSIGAVFGVVMAIPGAWLDRILPERHPMPV
jgi:hypothetical protein